jgi:hypothetical protein
MWGLWEAIPGERIESFEDATAYECGRHLSVDEAITGDDAYDWSVARVPGSACDGSGKVKANQTLQQLGYDGIHHECSHDIGTFGKCDVRIAFLLSQIKLDLASRYDAANPYLGKTH